MVADLFLSDCAVLGGVCRLSIRFSSALPDRPAGQKKAAQMVSAGFFAGSNCRVNAMIRILGTEVSAALVTGLVAKSRAGGNG